MDPYVQGHIARCECSSPHQQPQSKVDFHQVESRLQRLEAAGYPSQTTSSCMALPKKTIKIIHFKTMTMLQFRLTVNPTNQTLFMKSPKRIIPSKLFATETYMFISMNATGRRERSSFSPLTM